MFISYKEYSFQSLLSSLWCAHLIGDDYALIRNGPARGQNKCKDDLLLPIIVNKRTKHVVSLIMVFMILS